MLFRSGSRCLRIPSGTARASGTPPSYRASREARADTARTKRSVIPGAKSNPARPRISWISEHVTLRDKAYIVGALGYFILPIDLVPDLIAGLGYTDDLAVIAILMKHLKDNLTPEIELRADAKIRDLLE